MTLPALTSHSVAALEMVETPPGRKPAIAPPSQLMANSTAPPTESCIPDSGIAETWLDMRRDKTVAADHDKAAPSSRTMGTRLMPACSTFCHATSPTPRKPGTSAMRALDAGRLRVGKRKSISVIQNGIVARNIAPTPDGTDRCATASTPWQPTKKSRPHRLACSHAFPD